MTFNRVFESFRFGLHPEISVKLQYFPEKPIITIDYSFSISVSKSFMTSDERLDYERRRAEMVLDVLTGGYALESTGASIRITRQYYR